MISGTNTRVDSRRCEQCHAAARDRAGNQLALGTDVPDIGAKTHGKPDAAQDQRRRLQAEFGPAAPRRERLEQECAQPHQRVGAHQRKQQRASR
jgi:hypothetical protein